MRQQPAERLLFISRSAGDNNTRTLLLLRKQGLLKANKLERPANDNQQQPTTRENNHRAGSATCITTRQHAERLLFISRTAGDSTHTPLLLKKQGLLKATCGGVTNDIVTAGGDIYRR
jgi:hypothetical protein